MPSRIDGVDTGGQGEPMNVPGHWVSRSENAVWLFAGALLYLSFGFTEMQGSDLWWHVAAGQEILQQGTLWLVDKWSYTVPGADWHNHEWLADLIFFGWTKVFGIEALVYWKWLVIVATFLILHLVLLRSTGVPLAACASAAIAAAVAAPFLDMRPHLYTLLNYSILLWMLLGRHPRTWLLALFFLVWVNLHGGFFFGLMALAILLFPWRDLRLPNLSIPLRTFLVVAVVCLLNPDGVQSYLFPLKYAFVADSPYRSLGEWISPFREGGIHSPLFVPALGLSGVAALAYAVPGVRRAVGVPWEALALCALTALMAVTSRRFIPIFAISSALLIAPVVAGLCRRARLERIGVAAGIAALAFGIYRLLPYPLAAGPAYHYLTAEFTYPIETLDFMELNGLDGKVFARYNWGGYIHWRTDGRLKVFIDGRADTVYPDRQYEGYVQVLSALPNWVRVVESSGADYFLWPYDAQGLAQARELTGTGRWQLIYRDAVSLLAIRTSARLPGQKKSTPGSAWKSLGVAAERFNRRDYDSAVRYAREALERKPWLLSACNIQAAALVRLGQPRDAAAALDGCHRYFPSKSLLKLDSSGNT
jgi:hypothetical protein